MNIDFKHIITLTGRGIILTIARRLPQKYAGCNGDYKIYGKTRKKFLEK